jgi:hypothetical protein
MARSNRFRYLHSDTVTASTATASTTYAFVARVIAQTAAATPAHPIEDRPLCHLLTKAMINTKSEIEMESLSIAVYH